VVTAECPRERAEQRAIGGFETRADDLAPHHRELVAQHEDLDILGTIRAPAQDEQVDHEPDKTVETGHPTILMDPDRAVQIGARNPRSTDPGRISGTHRCRDHPPPAVTWRTEPRREARRDEIRPRHWATLACWDLRSGGQS